MLQDNMLLGPYAPGQYAPGPYAPEQYAPGPYAPGQYAPGPYAPEQYATGPYAPGQYAPGPYAPEPHVLGPYAPVPYNPGPLIIWKNILRQICSRTIFEMHTAQGAYGKHAPGAVCIQIMLLEHIWLRALLLIVYASGPYGPGAYLT